MNSPVRLSCNDAYDNVLRSCVPADDTSVAVASSSLPPATELPASTGTDLTQLASVTPPHLNFSKAAAGAGLPFTQQIRDSVGTLLERARSAASAGNAGGAEKAVTTAVEKLQERVEQLMGTEQNWHVLEELEALDAELDDWAPEGETAGEIVEEAQTAAAGFQERIDGLERTIQEWQLVAGEVSALDGLADRLRTDSSHLSEDDEYTPGPWNDELNEIQERLGDRNGVLDANAFPDSPGTVDEKKAELKGIRERLEKIAEEFAAGSGAAAAEAGTKRVLSNVAEAAAATAGTAFAAYGIYRGAKLIIGGGLILSGGGILPGAAIIASP